MIREARDGRWDRREEVEDCSCGVTGCLGGWVVKRMWCFYVRVVYYSACFTLVYDSKWYYTQAIPW